MSFTNRRWSLPVAAAALVAIGGAAGAVAVVETRPPVEMAPVNPVPIASVRADAITTVRGRVAEVYGNKFILADGSGRMLVDTGREGDGSPLVSAGDAVTAQGRFDRGFLHASFLVQRDGTVRALRPPHGPHGPGGRHGPPPPPDAEAPPPPAAGTVPAAPTPAPGQAR